jgi:CheY-like chemotaxis protein
VSSPTAYQVLVVDDARKAGSIAETLQTALAVYQDDSFEIQTAHTITDAKKLIGKNVYDIFILDMFLGGGEKGRDLATTLRTQGFNQPIILATGNKDMPSTPIGEFKKVFSQGPTYFYQKGPESILKVVKDAAAKSDILLRALGIFKRANVPFEGVQLGERRFSLDELLGLARDELSAPGEDSTLFAARQALRDGLTTLVMQSIQGGKKA